MGSRRMINLVLSTEKINDIQVCPTLYYYKHELAQTPIKKPYYYEEGDLMHKMLEIHYNGKMVEALVPESTIIEMGRNHATKMNLKAEEVEKTIEDFKMYMEHYRGSDSWEILGVEEPFAKEIYTDNELKIVLVGKNDLRVKTNRGNGPIALVDHKYESRFYQKLERDNQAIAYCCAWEIRDFIYNRIGKQKTKKEEDKLLRPYFSYSEYQIKDWLNSVVDSAHDIIRYTASEHWPMKFHGCGVHGKRCTFYDVCNTTPDNRAYKLDSFFKEKGNFSVMGKDNEDE